MAKGTSRFLSLLLLPVQRLDPGRVPPSERHRIESDNFPDPVSFWWFFISWWHVDVTWNTVLLQTIQTHTQWRWMKHHVQIRCSLPCGPCSELHFDVLDARTGDFWVNCSQPMGMKGQLAVARDCYHVLPCWSYRRVMNCAFLLLCSNVVLALFFHFLSIVLQVIKLRASARRYLASPPGSYTNHSTASTASTEICHEMSGVVLDQNCSKTCSKDVHFPLRHHEGLISVALTEGSCKVLKCTGQLGIKLFQVDDKHIVFYWLKILGSWPRFASIQSKLLLRYPISLLRT